MWNVEGGVACRRVGMALCKGEVWHYKRGVACRGGVIRGVVLMQHLNELEEVDTSQYQPAQSSVNLSKNRYQKIMPCEYLWVWHGACGCGQVQY